MDCVARIHLKTAITENRKELIRCCLENPMGKGQYLAIGWPSVYINKNKPDRTISSFEDYYNAVKEDFKKTPPVLNLFKKAQLGDLFWTRDLDGAYWICRATGEAQSECIESLGVGATLPVKAYKFGIEVPGQIKASFNRPRGGTSERITDSNIIEYSKMVYNELSNSSEYKVNMSKGNSILENLPDFELEELVISYIQLKENYYLLSNSIANKSTTIKIECEFIHRDRSKTRKAVVQVKGGKEKELNAIDYKAFGDAGYTVYFYAPEISNKPMVKNCIEISKKDLCEFYDEYKAILPDSITKWENLFEKMT